MTQPTPQPGGSRGSRLAGAALILLALGLLALGVYRILEDRVLTASGRVEVLTTFVEEGFDSRNRQDVCHHQVRYLDGPVDSTADVTSAVTCTASVGDAVTVYYDPANPANAAFEGGSYAWGDLAGILVLVAVLALPGWILVRG